MCPLESRHTGLPGPGSPRARAGRPQGARLAASSRGGARVRGVLGGGGIRDGRRPDSLGKRRCSGQLPSEGFTRQFSFARLLELQIFEHYFLFFPFFFLLLIGANLQSCHRGNGFLCFPEPFLLGNGEVCFSGEDWLLGGVGVALGPEMSSPNLRPPCRDSDPVSG